MISNRQGGRRRGRGGQRGQNLGGRPDGNRQDNRQRGNAAQLLEKYKGLARDAQLGGDRVQMEYYLQYADHYFRVLGESRARFEDQRRPRDDDGDEGDSDEAMADASDDQDDERQEVEDERPQRRERNDRGDRAERGERSRQYGRDDSRDEPPGGHGRPRSNGVDERMPLEALPPAIGRDDDNGPEAAEDEAPQRRRRSRRPSAEDGESDIAPAA